MELLVQLSIQLLKYRRSVPGDGMKSELAISWLLLRLNMDLSSTWTSWSHMLYFDPSLKCALAVLRAQQIERKCAWCFRDGLNVWWSLTHGLDSRRDVNGLGRVYVSTKAQPVRDTCWSGCAFYPLFGFSITYLGKSVTKLAILVQSSLRLIITSSKPHPNIKWGQTLDLAWHEC